MRRFQIVDRIEVLRFWVLPRLAAPADGAGGRAARPARPVAAPAAGLGWFVLAFLVAARPAPAGPMADVLVYFEQGADPAGGAWADPANAVDGDSGTGVSLGRWSDDPAQGTNDRPVGLVLGFSRSVRNGPGNDLIVLGNPFPGWYEPGYVEVARETSGLGATPGGWQDEAFYLLKPSNFDLVGDPRLEPLAMGYALDPNTWESSYGPGWSQSATGYADVAVGGDYLDIDWSIDANGSPVVLSDIAYVRIRTVTNDSTGWSYFSTEVMGVESIHGAVPEPATISLCAVAACLAGLVAMRQRTRSAGRDKRDQQV